MNFKENMRRFRTKNLNELNIELALKQNGIDTNILKQDIQTQEQSGTGDIFYNACMESIDDILARQRFGKKDHDSTLGYISIYPAPAGNKPTEAEFMACSLVCFVQPGNYSKWIDGAAEFKILPLWIEDASMAMEKRVTGQLLKADLINDDKTPKASSPFELALSKMISEIG